MEATSGSGMGVSVEGTRAGAAYTGGGESYTWASRSENRGRGLEGRTGSKS